MIPNYKEQLYTSVQVAKMGAGIFGSREDPSHRDALLAVLNEPRFGEAARKFAERYQGQDVSEALMQITRQIDAVLGSDSATTFVAR